MKEERKQVGVDRITNKFRAFQLIFQYCPKDFMVPADITRSTDLQKQSFINKAKTMR